MIVKNNATSTKVACENCGSTTVTRDNCVFRMGSTEINTLIEIKKKQQELEKKRADCDQKIEELRRDLIMLSISTISLKGLIHRRDRHV